MSQQYINIGAQPNDGLGDPIRTAFEKTNENFTQLYAESGNISNVIAITGNGISITGNITTGNYFIGNGAYLTGISGGNSGNANTGNVTFNDITIQGTGDEYGGSGLYLAPGTNSTANLQYLRVRGGDYPTHIHLDTGNNQYFDQYFGADSKFVKLEANGNVVINADDYDGNTASWTFDINGNATVPGAIIGAFGNLHLQPDPANAGSYLDIFLTSGPDLHLVASANANFILGNDNTSNIRTSWDGNVTVQSWNSNTGNAGGTWTFSGDGNLTLPSDTFAVNYANGNPVIINGAAGNAGDIQINVAGNIGADSTLRYVDNGGEMTLYADYLNAPGIFTSDIYAGDGTPSNITLTTSYGNAAWTFDATGTLSAPGVISATGNIYANNTIFAENVVSPGGVLRLFSNPTEPELVWTITNDGYPAGPNNSAFVSPLSDDIHVGEIFLQATTGNAIVTYAGPNNGINSNALNFITYGSTGGNIIFELISDNGNVGYISTLDVTGNLTIANNIMSLTSVTPPTGLANLTAVPGGRAFIDDGNLVAVSNFGVQVGNGGSNIVPVWSDGVNWYIG